MGWTFLGLYNQFILYEMGGGNVVKSSTNNREENTIGTTKKAWFHYIGYLSYLVSKVSNMLIFMWI